ncbi:MAG: NUDIX domain-containing protein [Bacteroidales bacterium]|nr:NUDIX domain-containing protein [Bacteroidales bacterium]
MFPVIETNGTVVAMASRSFCHGGAKPLHPAIHLHLINRNGEIYLQRRGAEKDLCPLMWDTAVGGHIAFGEYIHEALYREAGEEIALVNFHPVPLLDYLFESERERELVNVFGTVGQFQPKPDGKEVAEGRFWSCQEIETAIGKGVLTPNFEQEYPRIREKLLALL